VICIFINTIEKPHKKPSIYKDPKKVDLLQRFSKKTLFSAKKPIFGKYNEYFLTISNNYQVF